MRRAIFLPILVALLAVGCGDQGAEVHEEQFFAFGTVVDVVLHDVDEDTRERVLAELEQDLEYQHTAWHPWESGALGRVNQLLAAGGWFSAGPSILPLVRDAAELSRLSGYRFNPAIGKLVDLWGFHQENGGDRRPPDDAEIEKLLEANPTLDDIEIDGIRMRTDNEAVQIDFGGYAKGAAIDHAVDRFRRAGVEDAIVNMGGDLRAIGERGDRPWRIGIQHPMQEGAFARIDLSGDEALVTSGTYERMFEHDGERYHHIIDPETGYPAQGLESVTVLHDEATAADAAATALLIAGPDDWPRVARDMGVEHVMAINADAEVWITPSLRERIEFETAPERIEEVRP